jgi:asparagine synthase (glutamine-hydrolysing)
MRIAGKHKRPQAHNNVEKAVLRQAFDQPENPWLPAKVLWRQKEQFSDGVGYNWIDQIIAHCAQQVQLVSQTHSQICLG